MRSNCCNDCLYPRLCPFPHVSRKACWSPLHALEWPDDEGKPHQRDVRPRVCGPAFKEDICVGISGPHVASCWAVMRRECSHFVQKPRSQASWRRWNCKYLGEGSHAVGQVETGGNVGPEKKISFLGMGTGVALLAWPKPNAVMVPSSQRHTCVSGCLLTHWP